MREFERWDFGFCWNLRLAIELWYLEGLIWFLLEDFFWRLYFCMVKYLNFYNSFFALRYFLLRQANGHACVDFGCTHPIDGLFWDLPIYLLGFFSKYECWVTNLTMFLYHFIFLGYYLPLCIRGFIWLWNVKNNSYD
jgi:hypothetical protein